MNGLSAVVIKRFQSLLLCRLQARVWRSPLGLHPLFSLGSGVLAGTFTVQRFERENLQVVAIGTLVGTLTQ